MRLKEQRVWDTFKRHCPKEFFCDRVENMVGDGIPDVHIITEDGLCVWVELKAATRPKRSTTPLLGKEGLRQSQMNWHVQAAKREAPVFTLIRDDQGALYLVHCKHSDKLNEMTCYELNELSIASSWKDIFRYLRGDLL